MSRSRSESCQVPFRYSTIQISRSWLFGASTVFRFIGKDGHKRQGRYSGQRRRSNEGRPATGHRLATRPPTASRSRRWRARPRPSSPPARTARSMPGSPPLRSLSMRHLGVPYGKGSVIRPLTSKTDWATIMSVGRVVIAMAGSASVVRRRSADYLVRISLFCRVTRRMYSQPS